MEVKEKFIQVKAHAKKPGNNNRQSAVNNETSQRVDELIIIVFTFDYKLKEFYKVPWAEATKHIRPRGKKKPRPELNWSAIATFKQELNQLPRQDIIQFFK